MKGRLHATVKTHRNTSNRNIKHYLGAVWWKTGRY